MPFAHISKKFTLTGQQQDCEEDYSKPVTTTIQQL